MRDELAVTFNVIKFEKVVLTFEMRAENEFSKYGKT